MLFTSYAFIGFILVLIPLYYLIPPSWQWGLLLIASSFFYFLADPHYLLYIAVTAITVWFAAQRIEVNTLRQKAWPLMRKRHIA